MRRKRGGVVDFSRGVDGLPVTNLLKFFFEDGSWLAVRPSGTEPKIKFYYCIKDETKRSSPNFHS